MGLKIMFFTNPIKGGTLITLTAQDATWWPLTPLG